MKVQTTRQFKIIKPNKSKAKALNLTMRRYKKCLNYYIHGFARSRPVSEMYVGSKELYALPTGLIQTARDVAKEQYLSYKNNPDNPHFPHFTGLATARYDKRTISFQESRGYYKLWASIATVSGRVRVPVTSNEDFVAELLSRDFLAVQLLFRNGDFYLNVMYLDEAKIPEEKDFRHFVGIDRGSHNNLATVVVQDRAGRILETRFYSAKPLLEKRRRYSALRRSLGKAKQVKAIKKSKGREANYVRDQNHKISTDIIRLASKYEDTVIVLENLTGIRKNMNFGKVGNRKGHSWPFAQLEEMLVYKAHGNGNAIRRVYPRGTSSTCKDCFGPVRRSPSIQAVCIPCKKMLNADWLGAVNITRRLFFYMKYNLGRSESGPEQDNVEPTVKGTAPGVKQRLVARLEVS